VPDSPRGLPRRSGSLTAVKMRSNLSRPCIPLTVSGASTVPSGSRPARRRECAIAERAYPSTSERWQNWQRLAPAGSLSRCSVGICGSDDTPLTLMDCPRPEETLHKSTARRTSNSRGVRFRAMTQPGLEFPADGIVPWLPAFRLIPIGVARSGPSHKSVPLCNVGYRNSPGAYSYH
jgi:hypothetical protein